MSGFPSVPKDIAFTISESGLCKAKYIISLEIACYLDYLISFLAKVVSEIRVKKIIEEKRYIALKTKLFP